MIIRPVTDDDREMIAGWIASEPAHKASSPDYYFEPNTKSFVYEDSEGPVCVVRYCSALRLDIDFAGVSKDRIKQAMKQEFPGIAEQAGNQGFKELIFDSESRPLIAFCSGVLGFRSVADYRKVL